FTGEFGQQRLANGVVDLVGSCVIKIFTLQKNLRTTQFTGPALGEIEWRGTTYVVSQVFVKLSLKTRVVFEVVVDRLKLIQCIDQRFRDESPTVGAKVAFRVGKLAVINRRILLVIAHAWVTCQKPCLALWIKV